MDNSGEKGMGITLGALTLAALVFLLTQLQSGVVEQPMLKKQIAFFLEKKATLQTALKESEDLLKKREEQLQQAGLVEVKYSNLINGLLELSKSDLDARMISQKWKIQSSDYPSPSASGASQQESTEPKLQRASPRPAPAASGVNPKSTP